MQQTLKQEKDTNSLDSNLNTVVSFLLNYKKNSSSQIEQQTDYKTLHSNINNVVKDLDSSISECKKYNEAKIHRKYQIIINQMQSKIDHLQRKVMEQRKARSPSKKYVQDLLEKLINLQFRNQQLTKQINQLTTTNEQLKRKINAYQDADKINDQSTEDKKEKHDLSPKNKKKPIQKQQEILKEITLQISDQINSFLRFKHEFRKHQKSDKTSFQRFLIKIKQKAHSWSIRQFLIAVQKWNIQQKQYLQKSLSSQPHYLLPQKRSRILSRHNPSSNSKQNQLASIFSTKKNSRRNYLNLPQMNNRKNISEKKIEIRAPQNDCFVR